jgi:hypothetical protein
MVLRELRLGGARRIRRFVFMLAKLERNFKGMKRRRLEGVNSALEFSNRKKYRLLACAVQ